MRNNADMIVDRVWLGNSASAQDDAFLRQAKIDTVFNCTKDLPFHQSILRRYRVPIDDSLQEEDIRNLELWSVEVVFKILRELSAGRTVLVHCYAGVQRSAASVAMLLLATTKMTTDEAIAYIRSKRPQAFRPAVNFERSIRSFEAYVAKIRAA